MRINAAAASYARRSSTFHYRRFNSRLIGLLICLHWETNDHSLTTGQHVNDRVVADCALPQL